MPAAQVSGEILSPRLALVPLGADFLRASLAGTVQRARALRGWDVPDEWFRETPLMRMRLEDCESDPLYVPWSLRAIVLRASSAMVGHIGFHSRPGPEYLRALAPGGVELGYTVFEPHRRRGYATEAIRALVGWAAAEQGVDRFVVSISPDNAGSRRLAQKLGFERVGGHEDPVDGWEDVSVLQGEALHAFLRASR
jgi:[ribosomal protein S5]-alanine N-acetyltransferase